MTMEDLLKHVENAIAQYERSCSQEETLYDLIRDVEQDLNRYSAQSSAASDEEKNSAQRTALEQMREAALRLQQYQNELQQVQAAKAQAQRYLATTRSELTNVVKSIEEKLPKLDQSMAAFEQMASNSFGASAAVQLPKLRSIRDSYQRNLNDAYTLIDCIDSAFNGSGTSPQRVLRRKI